MSYSTSNKCKNCGGALIFDIETQQFNCNSCNITTDFLEEIDIDEVTEDLEASGYSCPNCGAQILADENTVSTFCVFCKNPAIIMDKFSVGDHPTKLIPFKVTLEKAKELYYEFIKVKKLAPTIFKTDVEIETITPIYVPFFLYDTDIQGDFKLKGTRVTRRETSSEVITTTKHYNVFTEASAKYEKMPFDGSEKVKDEITRIIEPFNYGEMINFSDAYLNGYFSENNDVDKDTILNNQVKPEIQRFLINRVTNDISGFDSLHVDSKYLNYGKIDTDFVLLPLYVLSVRYNDEIYQFLVNGQTGKVGGETPVSKKKVLGYGGLSFGIPFTLLWLGISIFEMSFF